MFRAMAPTQMKLFVKGDIDGFFALGLDNLLMLILMSSFCLGFPLFFPPELFFTQILPATAVGVLFGNVIYARMALQLAKKEGRDDVCALPYGVNLLTVFVYVFLVMFPAKLIALGQGHTDAEAAKIAWQAGIVACLGSGLIELGGSFLSMSCGVLLRGQPCFRLWRVLGCFLSRRTLFSELTPFR